MKPFYAPGRYVTRILKHDVGTTNNGNIQFVAQFVVIGKPDPDDPNKYFTEKVQLERRFYRVINDNTIEFATEDLKALGFAGESFAQLNPTDPKAWSFADVEIEMFCSHESDQKGELREVWSIARSGGSLVQEKADMDKLRKLDYVFRKNLDYLKSGTKPQVGAAARTRTRPAAVSTVSNQEITDSDIPF